MRSITRLNIQYAHRFLNYEGEAQYLHGHTGLLTIEVDGDVDARTGFVYPCNSIKRIAWDFLKNFDHELAKAYPECRLVVVKKVATCENLIEVFHSLLKDKLNIKKMTFASGDNCASAKF